MKSGMFNFLSMMSKGIPLQTLLNLMPQRALLPFYHSVSDHELPHIKHLYPSKTTKEFRKDLEFLLKHFEPVDFQTFLKYQNGTSKAAKPYCLLSFDDGLREFYEVIAPILLEKGIPAICFLNSDFVDNKGLFYRYKASLLVESYLNADSATKNKFQRWVKKELSETNVIRAILNVTYHKRHVLEGAAEQLEVDFDRYLQEEKPYLSKDQINGLIDQGFQFGGHSVDHPYFYLIALEDQLEQAIQSTLWVKDNFKLKEALFAFPFTDYGVKQKFFTNLQASGKVDYTFGTAGIKKDIQQNHWQRLAFEQEGLSGETIFRTEMLSYLLKIPFGKHCVKRK